VIRLDLNPVGSQQRQGIIASHCLASSSPPCRPQVYVAALSSARASRSCWTCVPSWTPTRTPLAIA